MLNGNSREKVGVSRRCTSLARNHTKGGFSGRCITFTLHKGESGGGSGGSISFLQ